MKRFNATGFFAFIVAILVAFTAYDYWSSQKHDEQKEAMAKVVQLKSEELSSIEITDPGGSRKKIVKQNRDWVLLEPLSEPADQQAVFGFIESLLAEKIVQVIQEGADLDFKIYGLDRPSFELKLRAGSREQTLKIGSVKAFDGSLYGQIDAQQKVVLFSSAWDVILTKPLNELRDKRLYRGNLKSDFDRIAVSGRVRDLSAPLSFVLVRSGDTWKLTGAADAIDSANVKAWIEQIKALRGRDYSTANASANALIPAQKFDVSITLERKGEKPFLLSISRDKKNFDLFESTSSDLPNPERTRSVLSLVLAKEAAEAVWVTPDVFFSRLAPFAFDVKSVARVVFNDSANGDAANGVNKKTNDSKVDPNHPDVMITKIRALEAVRFLGTSGGEKKFPSSLRLLNSEGGLVFEMSWGEPVIEKATADRPEARYLPVRTNLSQQVIGVAEKSIEDLSHKE